MAFYRVTFNEKHRFATVYNYGCTFHCPFCSYKLRSGAGGRPGLAYPAPRHFLSDEEIRTVLRTLPIDQLFFMGGEPTVAPSLPALLHFARQELGVRTKLGHTNGSLLPLPCLDAANVGFKAWSETLHRELTGHSKSLIYDNFSRAFDAGIKLSANMVFVPGLVDLEELLGLAGFLAKLDRNIPFHIMGCIPVPGQPFRRPTEAEMTAAENAVRTLLPQVRSSRLSPEDALTLSGRDDRFQVRVIAGEPLPFSSLQENSHSG